MKVLLKRPLFLAGRRFRVNPSGTDIPDVLDDLAVVLYKDWKRTNNELVLPSDAVLFTSEAAAKLPSVPQTEGRPASIALSQLPVQPDPVQALLDKAKK